jgi:hypothetical protein
MRRDKPQDFWFKNQTVQYLQMPDAESGRISVDAGILK